VPADAAGLQVGAGSEIGLDAEESRYLVKVRRVRVGGTIELFDGRGEVWIARVLSLGRHVRVAIEGPRPRPTGEPLAPRVVLLGLPDAAATLEAVTGACELGATQLVFVRCERSPGHLPSAGRIERVIRAAMRQCGRPSPPELLGVPPGDPWPLAQALAHRPELPGMFGDPHTTEPTAPTVPTEPTEPTDRGVRLLVGPEGGLSPLEIEAAIAAGFMPVRLGPWVLRTPTAVVALLARFGLSPASG
jgi:16S rRNA (uracil1498-N3)-methyltransferase